MSWLNNYYYIIAGGTIDITVHEVDSDRTLRELHKANGGDWGGISINKAFEELLMDILGKDVYEMIKLGSRDDFIFLQKEIETKKRKVTPRILARSDSRCHLQFLMLIVKYIVLS